jgi:hypothetical protein
MLAVLALVAFDPGLQGACPALGAAGYELPPDLGDAGALAASVETSDGPAEAFVNLVAAIFTRFLGPSPLARNESLKTCLGLYMDGSLGCGVRRAVEAVPAPERPEAHARFLSQFPYSPGGNPPAVDLDSLGLEGFEFEDYLKADLSFSDSLLATDSAEFSE